MPKKEHILLKAEALFAQRGYDATSVRDIAQEANINVAMISYYFGSKDLLMERLFEWRMSVGQLKVKEIIEDDTLNAIEKVEQIIQGYVNRVKKYKNFYRVILAEQTVNENQQVLKLLHHSRLNYLKGFDVIIQEGVKNQVFKNEVCPVLFITTITGTIMQALLNEKLYCSYHKINVRNKNFDDLYYQELSDHVIRTAKSLLGYETQI